MDTTALPSTSESKNIAAILAENEQLKAEIETFKMILQELEETNNNLVSATWRERDIKKKAEAVIEEQSKRITESVMYAKNIQAAINPNEFQFREKMPESFLIYYPKDIISGDFPWLFKTNKHTYVSAADCTGHGVPGSMLAIISNLLLTFINSSYNELTPADILNRLHVFMKFVLKQGSVELLPNDGLDCGIVRIDNAKKELQFAGAHRPLIFVSGQGVCTEYKGDKVPIGGVQYEKRRSKFTNTIIPFAPGDSFFLFSDGLTDQTGGENGKKFQTRQVVETLAENYQLPIEEIREAINNKFLAWKGEHKQVDDVILIGVKLGS